MADRRDLYTLVTCLLSRYSSSGELIDYNWARPATTYTLFHIWKKNIKSYEGMAPQVHNNPPDKIVEEIELNGESYLGER